MMKYTRICTLLQMLVFCIYCNGQSRADFPIDDTSSTVKGVAASTVPDRITRAITQDRKGNIWIATFGGVFRYDGKSFVNVTGKAVSVPFFSVLEDRKGNFWFASIGSGVYYYDGISFLNLTTRDGLVNDRVTDICEDKTGNIWFATQGGASCYDGKSFRNYLMYNDVNCITEDKAGKLWFGTRGSACIYDGKTFTHLTYNGKPFINVRAIIEDRKGNIWLGGSDGLWCYDSSTFTNFSKTFVSDVIEDKKGNIWTSSENDDGEGWTLSRYEEKSLFNKKDTLIKTNASSKTIFVIFEDRDGNIWLGANGVYRYDGLAFDDFRGNDMLKRHFIVY